MGEELQRARIERAMAEAMAAREDPHAVSVAEIVARAGISRRAFYDLYADREDCLLGAFESGIRLAGAEMYTAYARQARWQDGIRAGLAELLALIEREPAMARVCVVYALGGRRPVLLARMRAIELLCEFIDRGRLEAHGRTEPPEVAAEGVVGAVLAVLHSRLVAAGGEPPGSLQELLGPLMNLILLPYMGAARAGRELTRPAPPPPVGVRGLQGAPDAELTLASGSRMRVTYRTARVLQAVGERPGASNREVAEQAGIVDQGQISRLLSRLEGLGLVVNRGAGGNGASGRGIANAWVLTPRGEQLQRGAVPSRPAPRSRPARR